MRPSVLSRHRAGTSKLMHRMFGVVVVLKGLDGALEIVGGAALLFAQTGAIMALATAVTAREISEDPHDFVASLLRHWAAGFGHSAQMFTAAYLLVHGVAKVTLVTFLLMGKTWAYPVALTLFSILVAYAVFRLSLGWSWTLAGLVGLDLAAIGLIAREWRSMSARRA